MAETLSGQDGVLARVEGYLSIPHELLHVAAYRVMRKPYRYRLGEARVTSLSPLSRRERLFVLLLPLAVTLGFSLALYALSFATLFWIILPTLTPPIASYWEAVPHWHFGLIVLAILCMAYSGASLGDVLTAYRLLARRGAQNLREEPHHQAAHDQGNRQHE